MGVISADELFEDFVVGRSAPNLSLLFPAVEKPSSQIRFYIALRKLIRFRADLRRTSSPAFVNGIELAKICEKPETAPPNYQESQVNLIRNERPLIMVGAAHVGTCEPTTDALVERLEKPNLYGPTLLIDRSPLYRSDSWQGRPVNADFKSFVSQTQIGSLYADLESRDGVVNFLRGVAFDPVGDRLMSRRAKTAPMQDDIASKLDALSDQMAAIGDRSSWNWWKQFGAILGVCAITVGATVWMVNTADKRNADAIKAVAEASKTIAETSNQRISDAIAQFGSVSAASDKRIGDALAQFNSTTNDLRSDLNTIRGSVEANTVSAARLTATLDGLSTSINDLKAALSDR